MDYKCSKIRKLEKCMLSVLTAVFLTAVLALSNFAGLFSKTVHATQSATHTISFVANGGSGTMSNQTVYEGVSTQLNVVEFTRGGYEFTGWNTQADGSGASYSNQQAVSLTGDLNLYAQWTQAELISYTVTFKVVHGCWDDGTRNDKSVTYSRYSYEDLALRLQAGDIPAVGNLPSGGYSAGSWNNEPDTDTVLNGNVTYTYSYDRAVTASRADTNTEATPYTPTVNPLEIQGFRCSISGISSLSVRLGRQVQGPACQAVFRAHTPGGWHEAFTFNITLDDKASYSLKNGTLMFPIPEEFIKTGRKFALLGVDKDGIVTTYFDGDTDPNTISVYLDIEGYAFDLIYFD